MFLAFGEVSNNHDETTVKWQLSILDYSIREGVSIKELIPNIQNSEICYMFKIREH